MIIAYDTPGQLGNQLWAYSNLIAVAKENNVKSVIILQQNYFHLLDRKGLVEARKNKIYILDAATFQARIYKKLCSLALKKSSALLRKCFAVQIINDGDKSLTETVANSKKKIYLVNAWEQRIHTNSFIKESGFIRSIILPEQKSRDMAENRISQLRQSFDKIIAVHIRRGDYKEFLRGRFYFEDDIYLKKIRDTQKLLYTANVCFAVFSNEKINLKNFEGIDISFKNTNTAIGDMWGISLCDYILGPLSTFSMWASFWHNVPLLFIEKNTVIHSMEMFSPVIAQDLQKSGAVTSNELKEFLFK